MDPLSQAALGAAVAHACFHRTLGWRAATWGAIAGAAPDLDVVAYAGTDEYAALIHHRGITHSVFFAPVIGPVWGWLLHRRERRHAGGGGNARLLAWIGVITLALWSHPALDYLTPYGTQLLAPFSRQRFALNAMPIIDPIYTFLLIAGLALAYRWRRSPRAAIASIAGLMLSSAYLAYGWHLNKAAQRFAEADLVAEGVTDAEVVAYPTILQVHLRRVVARTPDLERVGLVSMWNPCNIDWDAARREQGPLIERMLDTREGAIFAWFTMGNVGAHVESLPGGGHRVRLVDLRYGASTDPTESIFASEARFDAAGALVERPHMVSFRPSPGDPRIMSALNLTYARCVS